MAESNHASRRHPRLDRPAGTAATGSKDIIVLGGSAGAIEAIRRILADLPADLPAAVFVVVHTGPSSPDFLADIFGNASRLPVQYAVDREPIELGKVYVAPRDQHLLIKRGEVRVVRGPKENNFRPALDPLFRTAATTYESRVIGVVVSGLLDDGTHGLLQIKRAGGITVVQSPEDAVQKSMPQSAIDRVNVDYIKPAAEIGQLLRHLISESGDSSAPLGDDEADVSEGVVSVLRLDDVPPPSPFVCPECRGALWELQDGAVVKFRCHVGHAYALDTLLSQQAISIEQALWSAIRGFEERAELQRRTSQRTDIGNADLRTRLLEGAREQQQMADTLRSLVVGPQFDEDATIGEAVRREYAG